MGGHKVKSKLGEYGILEAKGKRKGRGLGWLYKIAQGG